MSEYAHHSMRHLAVIVALVLAGSMGRKGWADVIFNDGNVHDITTSIAGRVSVSDGLVGPTTVNVLPTGSVSSTYMGTVDSSGHSAVNGVGGTIWGGVGLSARNFSTASISDGNVSGSYQAIGLSDSATLNISGGLVQGTGFSGKGVYATGSPTVNISGGLVRGSGSGPGILARNSTAINITGGFVYSDFTGILVYDTCTVNISYEGQVSGLLTYNSSAVSMTGGQLGGLEMHGSTDANVTGGLVGGVLMYGSSALNISDGNLRSFEMHDSSTVNVSGGQLGNFLMYDSSILTVNASVLNLGGSLSLDGNRVLGSGVMSGQWFDGTTFSTSIDSRVLTPEPATLSLLAMGGLALIRRKRRP